MKVFARWIKASLPNSTEEEYFFRKNTILQFGYSWDVIGAAILINPGSAAPTEEVIDCETKLKLQKVSNSFDDNGEWKIFKEDSTMRFLEKIFSGWYIGQHKRLEGVILLYNLFNIRCQDLAKALELRFDSRLKDYNDMVTKPDELTTLDVPIYIGWGNTGKYILDAEAEILFNYIRDRVCHYTGDDFKQGLFYHPLYVNTSYQTDAIKNLLCRFLSIEGNSQPLLIMGETVGSKIIEILKSRIDRGLIVETFPTKLLFKLCDNNLVVAIVVQKNKQYIYWQHSNYNKRKNYRNFSSNYHNVVEIRSVLESYDYNINSDSSLGEKSLKNFSSTNIEEITNMILEEIQEISDKINTECTRFDLPIDDFVPNK